MLGKLILHLHFTKSLECNNISKLCLWITEEHTCLILTPKHVSRPRYDAHTQEYKLLLHSHSGITIFIHCIYEW